MNFRDNFLLYTIAPLMILLIGASYVRFMVLNDYMIAYEGDCDPIVNNCFIGCEDEECTVEYYYANVQKYAPKVFAQCGDDISECENASVCLPEGDERCFISYCDLETDGDACETQTAESEAIENTSMSDSLDTDTSQNAFVSDTI